MSNAPITEEYIKDVLDDIIVHLEEAHDRASRLRKRLRGSGRVVLEDICTDSGLDDIVPVLFATINKMAFDVDVLLPDHFRWMKEEDAA